MQCLNCSTPPPKIQTALSIVGGLFLAKTALRLMNWSYQHLLSLSLPNNLISKYGNEWVVITGGSAGIGFSFAKQFLQQNFKVLLISSNESKLKNAQNLLQSLFENSTVDYIQYDFNKAYTDDEVESLSSAISQKTSGNISVLINNVGCITRANLTELSNEQINAMININVTSVTFITKIVVQFMKERQMKGLIIASGSVAGRMRYPGRSIYSATKAYLEAFSETIPKEHKGKIDCTYLEIGPVETELNQMGFPLTISPDDLAKQSMRKVGKFGFTTGHLKHEVMTMMWNLPCCRERLMKGKKKEEE